LDNSNIKIGTNKSFGIVFFVFFLIVSIFPLLNNGDIRVWSLIISLIFLILGILNSKILTPLNQVWFKFGILLGRFVSPVVMGAIFFAIVTPTAVIMKVLRKNLLNLKKGNKKTYWIEKSKIKSKMKNQF
jgi:predicted membrane protein